MLFSLSIFFLRNICSKSSFLLLINLYHKLKLYYFKLLAKKLHISISNSSDYPGSSPFLHSIHPQLQSNDSFFPFYSNSALSSLLKDFFFDYSDKI